MEKFTPSINWGHELVASSRWILEAWAISGTCLLIVAIVVVRFTRWGGQFWRITGDYFTGRRSAPVLTMFNILLLSVMVSVRLTVLFTYYSNDLYSALQTAFQGAATGNDAVRDSGIHGFWVAIWTFCIIAALDVIQVMADLYLAQRFFIRWRVWLTNRLTADWLDGRAYYRERFVDPAIDNPDQRIQQDIDIFTAGVGGAANSPVGRYIGHVAFRRDPICRLGGVLRRDFVGPVRHVSRLRGRHPEGAVLGLVRLCPGSHRDRVLDRPPADQVQLP